VSDQPGPPGRPPLSSADLVRRLWDEVRRAGEAPFISAVPDLGETPPMVHDADLSRLNAHPGITGGEADTPLLGLLNALAERQDRLAAEVRLLREALKGESERLAERDETLHRLLEARLEGLGGADG